MRERLEIGRRRVTVRGELATTQFSASRDSLLPSLKREESAPSAGTDSRNA